MPTVFSNIIAGNIPSYCVFENQYVYAFLDISPISLGHTLVVPKIEVDNFTDVPEPYYSEVFKVAKIIASAIQKATQSDRVGCFIQGFDVPHFHYHLVPINSSDSIKFEKKRLTIDSKKMEEIAQKIRSNII